MFEASIVLLFMFGYITFCVLYCRHMDREPIKTTAQMYDSLIMKQINENKKIKEEKMLTKKYHYFIIEYNNLKERI